MNALPLTVVVSSAAAGSAVPSASATPSAAQLHRRFTLRIHETPVTNRRSPGGPGFNAARVSYLFQRRRSLTTLDARDGAHAGWPVRVTGAAVTSRRRAWRAAHGMWLALTCVGSGRRIRPAVINHSNIFFSAARLEPIR